MSKSGSNTKVLLAVLAVLIIFCGYMVLFRTPTLQKIDDLTAETEINQTLLDQLNIKVERKQFIEREIENMFKGAYQPVLMPDYDNVKAVIFELNEVLRAANQYSITFEGVDSTPMIIERNITIPFTCANYQTAYNILNTLENGRFRCMVDNMSIAQNEDGTVNVNANLTFFEYNNPAA